METKENLNEGNHREQENGSENTAQNPVSNQNLEVSEKDRTDEDRRKDEEQIDRHINSDLEGDNPEEDTGVTEENWDEREDADLVPKDDELSEEDNLEDDLDEDNLEDDNLDRNKQDQDNSSVSE